MPLAIITEIKFKLNVCLKSVLNLVVIYNFKRKQLPKYREHNLIIFMYSGNF